jgi:hypothetical protein
VKWSLAIQDAAGKPTVSVSGAKAKAAPADLDAKIQALAGALVDFLPVPGPIEAIDCTDNYPEWKAELTFDDGTKLALDTNRSNLLGVGGPWQATIDGVHYLQLAPDFLRAVGEIVEPLGLPIGQPAAFTCPGYDLDAAALGK